MQTFLGVPGTTLINGTSSWDDNVFNAANDWNGIGAIQFTVNVGTTFRNPCGSQNGQSHVCTNTGPVGDNPVFFASSFCGQAFGDAIEVTNNCWSSRTGQMFNAPVFVSANVQWDAYDGPIRFSTRGPVYDIRRVLLHELGHVLGLSHPDEGAQTVTAIMNSRVSSLDRLQADDINGARLIYATNPEGSSSPTTGSGCQMRASRVGDGWLPLLVAAVLAVGRRRRPR